MFLNYSARKFQKINITVSIGLLLLGPLFYWLFDLPLEDSIWISIVPSVIFFALFSLFLYIANREIHEVQHVKTVPYPKDMEMSTLVHHLSNEKNWRLIFADHSRYVMETPMTSQSFGEHVTMIRIGELLQIESSQKVPSKKGDGGRNERNIEDVLEFVPILTKG